MKPLTKFLWIIIAFLSVFTAPTYGDIPDTISFQLLRNTYVEDEKSISISLRNKGDNPYLVQSSMEILNQGTGITLLDADTKTVPFIITPPLHKLEGKQRYHWRIMFSGDLSKMPDDRESVYIAKFKALPSSDSFNPNNVEKKDSNSELSVVRVINFKVYYRPKKFEDLKIKDEVDKLKFRVEGDQLVVTNDSPIYMSFEDISVDSVGVDGNETFKPLIPKGEQRFKLENKSLRAGAKVTWRVLDEFSMPLEAKTTTL